MLRNKVIREVKKSVIRFYESQISHLKNSKWWSAIKDLAGHSKKSLFFTVEIDGSVMRGKDFAIAINKALIVPSKMMPPSHVCGRCLSTRAKFGTLALQNT